MKILLGTLESAIVPSYNSNNNNNSNLPELPNSKYLEFRKLAPPLSSLCFIKCLLGCDPGLAAYDMTHPMSAPAPSGFKSGNIAHSHQDLYL